MGPNPGGGAMSKARFAVIGTGRMAAAMMPTFAAAGVHVTAVASHDPQRSRKFAHAFGIPTAVGDVASVLHSGNVDAVYIANAAVKHATTAVAALEAGKAVLCEKPLARSADESELVMRAAQRTGKLCMEGIWTLFLPAYHRFFELARTGACGEPRHLIADFGYPVSQQVLPRLVSPAADGVLLDRGIYLIALALKVFGAIERIDARLDIGAHGVDQHASLLLGHRGGGHSQLSASFTTLMTNTAALGCSRGIVRLEEPLIGAEMVSVRLAAAKRAQPQDATLPLGAGQKFVRMLRQSTLLRRLNQALPKARREYLSYGPDQYLPQLKHFLTLLKTGARESDVIPLEVSLDIQRVIGRARMHDRC